jgi:hypothetical protein
MLIFELPTCENLFIVLNIGLLYYKYTIQVYFTYLFLNYWNFEKLNLKLLNGFIHSWRFQ